MGFLEYKPVKIKLNNGLAGGMYILLETSEVKYTKDGESKAPPRAYKIQIAVEVSHTKRRCRGKKVFNVKKGTSVSKAVNSLLGHREDMKEMLRANGTLKVERKLFKKIDTKDKKFAAVFDTWIEKKRINKSQNTIRTYQVCYNNYLIKFKNKIVTDINEDDIQNLINEMINKGKSAGTIIGIKKAIKPLLELNGVQLNWKSIEFPEDNHDRKFNGTDDEAKLIAKTLLEYEYPVARGVFTFLLSGRRVGETLLMEYNHINYTVSSQYPYGTFRLPASNTKTATEVTYGLTESLIDAIKIQNTTTGKIFDINQERSLYHFKKAMKSIGVQNMVMHDLRSMVAVVALRNGADIYSVSKMLAHKQLSTTEANYLGHGVERAKEAQDAFIALIGETDKVIDVEIDDSEFTALKNIYPDASDEKIYQIIELVKKI
jgi:integrase